jgi:uncharacterized protein YdaU (DUF1376 family)
VDNGFFGLTAAEISFWHLLAPGIVNMSRPWMPLWVADYLADTAHLNAAQSGGYLHLIMHYWQHGGLPDDDRQLAQIAKMTLGDWRKHRPVIEKFFSPGWKHNRVDEELLEAEEKYQKRASAGHTGGVTSGENRTKNKRSSSPPSAGDSEAMLQANDEQCFKQTASKDEPATTTITEIDDGGDARAREDVNSEADSKPWQKSPGYPLAHAIAKLCGDETVQKLDLYGWHGAADRAELWRKRGWPEEHILNSIREQVGRMRNGPPYSIKFFEKGITRYVADLNAPLPEPVIVNGEQVHVTRPPRNERNCVDAAQDLMERVHALKREPSVRGGESSPAVRLLSEE